MLKGGRQEMLRAAWDAGERSLLRLWDIVHAPGRDEFGFWWSDPEYRVSAIGHRETPCPAHGFANLLYWLKHGRMWMPDGSIPFLEGDVALEVTDCDLKFTFPLSPRLLGGRDSIQGGGAFAKPPEIVTRANGDRHG